MKPNITKQIASLVILPSAALAFTACSNIGGTDTVTMVNAPNGAAVVETYTNSATVTAIDSTHRKLSLKLANGTRKTVKCGSGVVNFPQIKVGDVIKVTLVDEVAIYLGGGESRGASATGAVALAPVGSKPGGVMAETVRITATVTAFNTATRMVSLKLPDGSSKSLKVGSDVNLKAVKVGDTVTVRHTEAMAIVVEA